MARRCVCVCGFDNLPNLVDTVDVENKLYGKPSLGSPNQRCKPPSPGVGEGGKPDMEGANCEYLGNVLIIQADNEDNTIPDSNNDGGIIILDFPEVVKYEYGMGLLDINNTTSITVPLTQEMECWNCPQLMY